MTAQSDSLKGFAKWCRQVSYKTGETLRAGFVRAFATIRVQMNWLLKLFLRMDLEAFHMVIYPIVDRSVGSKF